MDDNNNNNKERVSLDTTLPWLESVHSHLTGSSAEREIERMAALKKKKQGMPFEIVVQPEAVVNYENDDEDELDIVDIAMRIEQKRSDDTSLILAEARQLQYANLETDEMYMKPAAIPKESKSAATVAGSKKYTSAEELIICKAYIATSEDPICGNKIGSKEFCHRFQRNYCTLLDEYVREQILLWKAKKRRESHSSKFSNKDNDQEPVFEFDTRTGKILSLSLFDC